jgi:hypothetical protein
MLPNAKVWLSADCSQNKIEPAAEYFRESTCLHRARTSQDFTQNWKSAKRGTISKETKDEILHDHNDDAIDRRGFLKCMAWTGTGALCVMKGGILKSDNLSRLEEMGNPQMASELSFVQITDSHMGFNKPANSDVAGTLKSRQLSQMG